MKAVSDSGPLIHLALITQTALLARYFEQILIVPAVYDEVVTQRLHRIGVPELREARASGFIRVVSLQTSRLPDDLRLTARPSVSPVDAQVVALAIEQRLPLLSDDKAVRTLAIARGLTLAGTLNLLIQATRDGVITSLKPTLDELIANGFHMNPTGQLYREVLRQAGEQ